ncbi:MAG: GNAT family N-acetyltransferase [Bacteroidetes bacterium]|nr:MAG: GNAT family N-acetyltransferase [Bacteroidota bacterium]
MSAAILAPKRFSPLELDRYLAQGWRPLGQRIYTADFIQVSLGEVYGVTPTRLPLHTHTWRKGQRKLIRKNNEVFEFSCGPARVTPEKHRINALYRKQQPSKSPQELDIHIEHDGRRIFQTQEICVYHQGQLVAFSFFDVGAKSAYSKVGIYDPDFAHYSLGLYTMYLEVQWCQDRGFEYYYPGYVSTDTPLFDYKRRLGKLYFRDLCTKSWIPLEAYQPEQHGPLQLLRKRLNHLEQALTDLGQAFAPYEYIFFEMPLTYPEAQHFLDTPAILLVHCPLPRSCWVAIYDVQLQLYQCWETVFEQAITFFDPAAAARNFFRYVLQKNRLLCQSETADGLATHIWQLLRGQEAELRPREQ